MYVGVLLIKQNAIYGSVGYDVTGMQPRPRSQWVCDVIIPVQAPHNHP